jgi:hypothetical protein
MSEQRADLDSKVTDQPGCRGGWSREGQLHGEARQDRQYDVGLPA